MRRKLHLQHEGNKWSKGANLRQWAGRKIVKKQLTVSAEASRMLGIGDATFAFWWSTLSTRALCPYTSAGISFTFQTQIWLEYCYLSQLSSNSQHPLATVLFLLWPEIVYLQRLILRIWLYLFSAHGHLNERLWGKSSDGRNEGKEWGEKISSQNFFALIKYRLLFLQVQYIVSVLK